MKDQLKKVKKPTSLIKTKNKKLGLTKKKAKKATSLIKTKKKKLGLTKKKAGKQNEMEGMSVDEFMSGFMNEEEDTENSFSERDPKNSKKKSVNRKLKQKINGFHVEKNGDGNDEDGEEDNEESDVDVDEFKTHKQQLKRLKESDPEFYKYLEENDQNLLNFDDSDLDSDDEKKEKFHKTPDALEVASDESDYELDEEIIKKRKGKSNRVTVDMIKQWQKEINTRNNMKTLREVAAAFHAAVVSVSPEDDQTSVFKVEGGTVFNSVIRMCVMDFLPGVQRALRITSSTKVHPEKCKNWKKVRSVLRSYLNDLLELCSVTSPSMLRVLLKHIHQMSPFIVCFPSISPQFIKRAIQLWTMDEDVIRVLAFLCAFRMCNLRTSLLRRALKVMHLTYARNTKFVSPSTLPGINFMRQSLCEMFALDDTTSYHMLFLYIRQLAIHLRNAITQKKKDSHKTVYNWAFVSCLHLWAELFGLVPNNSPLKSLIYPLVQITIGTIKLIPSAQYYPLRFHCCRILIQLSSKCGVFIPILPFLLEVLRDFDFNREHKKLSMKPMDLTCLLRCSKSQMKENGFKDALIENVHNLLMEYLATECHRLSFPDMTVVCVIQIKQFLKKCSNANYTKKIKVILDKITENSKFIENERKKLNLKLSDLSGAEAAEMAIRSKEPPFLKYYESWKKIHLHQEARKVTNNQKLGDFKLPVLYKLDKKRTRVDTKSTGPPELFPSDDEDSDSGDIFKDEVEEDDEETSEPPKKKKKEDPKPQSKIPINVRKDNVVDEEDDEDDEDVVVNLNYSDL